MSKKLFTPKYAHDEEGLPIYLKGYEYDLLLYCLEQQWSEFSIDEAKDADNIIDKLSKLTEVI
tara:strand:+ start:284 stop:472 length:189 start_codon:yes stop_codon:yes gene_type:complete